MDEKTLPVTDASIETSPVATPSSSRRDFLKQAGALGATAGIMSLVPDPIRQAAWAAGSDAPELKEVKVGFIPLTDCSSVVMASVLEIDKKYGIKIVPTKEASWAGVREIGRAHV